MKHPLHPLTWLMWLAAAMVALTVTRNPLYLAVTLLCIGMVYALIAPAADEQRSLLLSPWRFGLVVVTVSALFNALMVHVGAHVLFTLPAWLPLIGGPFTLEALVYGALNGLALTGLFVATALIAAALHLIVEKPGRAWIRRRFESPRTNP